MTDPHVPEDDLAPANDGDDGSVIPPASTGQGGARHGSGVVYDAILGFTMEEFLHWARRSYCLVCEHPLRWQEDADDTGCLCTGLTEVDYA